jgi:hypothetical protein
VASVGQWGRGSFSVVLLHVASAVPADFKHTLHNNFESSWQSSSAFIPSHQGAENRLGEGKLPNRSLRRDQARLRHFGVADKDPLYVHDGIITAIS